MLVLNTELLTKTLKHKGKTIHFIKKTKKLEQEFNLTTSVRTNNMLQPLLCITNNYH